VTTGAVDTVERPERMSLSIANGDPLMAEVTAVGCATGALMAALAAITPDAPTAAAAALIGGGIAGEIAARQARGPGDFAVRWIDAVARLDAATILAHARVTTRRQET
jgi:hydroxyethylthiazole kinase